MLFLSSFPRLAARLRSRRLDRALIDGADPASSVEVAARAAQLTAECARAEIAEGLERLVRSAAQPGRWQIQPAPAAVKANEPELHELAARLREPGPVYAQGIAILHELLSDGTGPAYTDRHGNALSRELQHANEALTGGI